MSTARAATPFSPSPSPSPPHHGAGGEHAQNAPDTDAARSHSNAQHALGGSGGQHGGELAHPGSGGPGGPAIEDRDELVRRELEMRVRTAVNALYELAVCAADVQEGAQGLVGSKINDTVHALAELDAIKTDVRTMIPSDVIELLDHGRNPDIHSRTFVDRLASENMYTSGKLEAIENYRDVLGPALATSFPSLAEPIAALNQNSDGDAAPSGSAETGAQNTVADGSLQGAPENEDVEMHP